MTFSPAMTQTKKGWSRALTSSSSLILTALLSSSLLASVQAAPAPLPTYVYTYDGAASVAVETPVPTPTTTAAGGVPAFFQHFPWPTVSHAAPSSVDPADPADPADPEPTATTVLVPAIPTPSLLPVISPDDNDVWPSPSPTSVNVQPTTVDVQPSPANVQPSPAPAAAPSQEPFVSLPFEAPELHFDDEVGGDVVGLGAVSFSAKSSSSKPYVNNWKCKPTADKPAVVLVHATLLTANSWDFMAPKILKQGYCVFALTYGKIDRIPLVGAVDYLENSAAQVGDFVDQVLQATNTTQVNLVGHSQGGIVGRYWMKFLGGQGKVKKYIGIAPIQQGTTLSGIVLFGKATGLFDPAQPAVDFFCPGCYQMVYDSDFMKKLNKDGDTIPGVIHSNIATRLDQIVTPWRNSFQKGPSTNNILQDYCLLALNEHLTIIANPITVRWVLNQLDTSSAKTVNCLTVFDRF